MVVSYAVWFSHSFALEEIAMSSAVSSKSSCNEKRKEPHPASETSGHVTCAFKI